MKDQFLKLAGVKSDKEFYKLFPDEKSFMAKYGKKVKKLQIGGMIKGDKLLSINPETVDFQKMYDQSDMMITGSTQGIRQKKAYDESMLTAQNKKGGGLGDMLGNLASVASTAAQFAGSAGGAKNGKTLRKALFGDETLPMNNTKGNKTLDTISKYAGPAGQIYQGFQQMKDEKQTMFGAQQMQEVSDVALQASLTKPEQIRREYVRPDNPNMIMQPGQFQNPYGQGTNILSAKNGGEITNTFAPNTIYKDLGYAADGGMFSNPSSDFGKGVYSFAEQGGGDVLSNLTAGIGNPAGYGNSGAGKIGGTIGGTAGMLIGGPVGKMIGQVGGQAIGNLLDRKAEKTEFARDATRENINKMAMGQGAQSLQRQNVSYMENGGVMNPQIINQFGDYRMNQLLQPDPYMDTLRTGGQLRQNTMAMGGDLRTHWGGYAEPMSYNPYLPNGGETVMFRGRSHDESVNGKTGIGITYEDKPVEVERGEPAVQLKNGTDSSSNLTVFGNLEIPEYGVEMLQDPNAKGKKFKNYISDLSKIEKRQNKLMDNSVKSLNNLETDGSFSNLSSNSYMMNMLGANMELKRTADKKIKASNLQSAINDTAEEYGFEADALAKGKVKQAKMGTSIQKADRGFTLQEQNKAQKLYESGDVKAFQEYAQSISPEIIDSVMEKYGAPTAGVFNDSLKGKRTDEVYSKITDSKSLIPMPSAGMASRNPFNDPIKLPANMPGVNTTRSTSGGDGSGNGSGSEFDWMNIANQILPYMRPTDAESLDPNQLAGEMYALSTNQLEPVQAQSYQPQLSTPYDISLQDQLNANQSDYRAAQRMMGYNPAAQSMLNAQKYQANQQVLGEQFRMNQAMKDRVYGENRNALNDAQLKNLAIYDNQYERQSAAKSNTKATTQAALSSIASKYAQNQLENRQLQTYENLYNYRYDPRGRAVNMNPLQQFDTELASMSSQEIEQLAKQRAAEEKTKAKGSNTARNGSIVRSYK